MTKSCSAHYYIPTHPHIVIVEFQEGAFNAQLKAAKPFRRGEAVISITGTSTKVKAYDTLQCGGVNDHLSLDSDLRYSNHSCAPNTAWDMSANDRSQWHVRAIKHIEVGDSITFFYPSTDWEMDQPFKCNCGTNSCLGTIRGAKYLSLDALLTRGFVNPGILEMIKTRESEEPIQKP